MNHLVYFEQIAGSARKFYLMTEDDGGSTFTANYGRIGTAGSVKTYPMSKWQHVYNTRIQHGYTDKTPGLSRGANIHVAKNQVL